MKKEKYFETEYGYFGADGSYIIKGHNTPKPWINVISNGKYGIVVSQTGGGFSWYIHSNFNRITRWFQDLIKDDWGKYIYIKEKKSGKYWSTSYQPTKRRYDYYRVKHSFGYSDIVSRFDDIESKYTIFVPIDYSLEVWRVRIKNNSTRKRKLSLYTYFEWCLGDAPDNHREFFKTFIETEFKKDIIFATKRLWNLKNRKGEHLNRKWDYIAYHFSNSEVISYDTEKVNFIGRYGDLNNPKALKEGKLKRCIGKWNDPIGSLHIDLDLASEEEKEVVFVLGLDSEKKNIYKIKKYFSDIRNVDKELDKVKKFWENIFAQIEVKTSDKSIDLLLNKWLKYQAISCRLWARAAYYQQSGAYGFRDQLQDSQIFLTINPNLTKEQIRLHTKHQFNDGRVYHWWHPISEEGLKNNISDNLLWLPFLVYRYLIETKDFKFLDEKIKYVDKGKESLYKHCLKTFNVVLSRMSKRYLPLIGGGDWNDGLNAVGTLNKGESIWLGFFFYYILDKWQKIFDYKKDKKNKEKFKKVMKKLKNSLIKYGWDGKWFIRAIKDNGELIGSTKCKEGKIFLNPQSWAVLSNAVDKKFQKIAMESVKKYLVKSNGPVLFYPAYTVPDENIGYLTRYAPGVRENGGVYFHAACWALWAFLETGEKEYAYKLYKKLSPILSGKKPEKYQCEPYVTPGNIDGPNSPFYGKGGWTWYTGSAAWFYTVLLNEFIGIKPEWDGLKIEPKIPSKWKKVYVKRYFRNSIFNIKIINQGKAKRIAKIIVDGKEVETNILSCEKNKVYNVEVYLK
ncbi:MAG: glycosyl transferase family 36 [Spirochaetes bacterium]|nr:MAG: glycosyl transferase family 36 [Spirochaetota bacterium]